MNFVFSAKHLRVLCIFLLIVTLSALTYISAPLSYPVGQFLTVPAGATVREVGEQLKHVHAIHSVTAFVFFTKTIGGGVTAGMYSLKKSENVLSLAYRFSRGVTGVSLVKVTIPEGVTTNEMGDIITRALGVFDTETFKKLAASEEGYLFPETYFLLPNTPPEEVIRLMRRTFDEKTALLQTQVTSSSISFRYVVVMASILEREARQSETRRMVAGILWKRISLGMPLQVDAVFSYIFKKSGYSPTLDDLKIDSLYNTYTHKGLPPGPIGNPGLSAVEDALHPTQSPYLYYLTDKEGNIYYAKTFAEHVANKARVR